MKNESCLQQDVRQLVPVAKAAGALIAGYDRRTVAVTGKNDGTPVTRADQAAEDLIIAHLARIAPAVPVVGEESVAAGRVPDISGGRFFLVDALDGTRAFIDGGADFTVNIALLENNRPVMGVIYAPVSGALYYADQNGAWMQDAQGRESVLRTRDVPAAGLTVLAGRHYTPVASIEKYMQDLRVHDILRCSSSLKFCMIAQGLADIYPRLGPTSEWDVAAGMAILTAAGGQVTRLDGTPLTYGKVKQNFVNPHFVAHGGDWKSI